MNEPKPIYSNIAWECSLYALLCNCKVLERNSKFKIYPLQKHITLHQVLNIWRWLYIRRKYTLVIHTIVQRIFFNVRLLICNSLWIWLEDPSSLMNVDCKNIKLNSEKLQKMRWTSSLAHWHNFCRRSNVNITIVPNRKEIIKYKYLRGT